MDHQGTHELREAEYKLLVSLWRRLLWGLRWVLGHGLSPKACVEVLSPSALALSVLLMVILPAIDILCFSA